MVLDTDENGSVKRLGCRDDKGVVRFDYKQD